MAAVVDVRRFPSSRFEHFRREKLAGLLSEAGIGYVYMGEELGGYRRGGYQNFTATPEFQTGLKRMEEVARRRGGGGHHLRRAIPLALPPAFYRPGTGETGVAGKPHY